MVTMHSAEDSHGIGLGNRQILQLTPGGPQIGKEHLHHVTQGCVVAMRLAGAPWRCTTLAIAVRALDLLGRLLLGLGIWRCIVIGYVRKTATIAAHADGHDGVLLASLVVVVE